MGFRSVYKVIHHGKRDVMVANDRVMLKHVYIRGRVEKCLDFAETFSD